RSPRLLLGHQDEHEREVQRKTIRHNHCARNHYRTVHTNHHPHRHHRAVTWISHSVQQLRSHLFHPERHHHIPRVHRQESRTGHIAPVPIRNRFKLPRGLLCPTL